MAAMAQYDLHFSPVAPPRGERGLKYRGVCFPPAPLRRSPSWGAWIEMLKSATISPTSGRRSPSWGAWIEIIRLQNHIPPRAVAPPRGERGLKCYYGQPVGQHAQSLPLVGSVD